MADAFVSTTTQSNLVTAAVDRYVRAALRHTPLLRKVADTRPVQVDRPGSSVALYTYSDLAAAITPLTETTDPDAVAIGNPTATTITLNEYGNVSIATLRVGKYSFSDIDPNQLDQITYNMRDTLDVLVREIISAGTNVIYADNAGVDATATNQLTAAHTFKSPKLRKAVAKLRTNAAPGRIGDLYWCGMHPEVAHDLKAESGAGSFREAHVNAAPSVIWPNVTGVYEGAVIVETARMKMATDGAASAKAYRTIVAGAQALAEAVADEPHTEIGVVPDKLNRFFPLGWRGILGWSIFRQGCLYRIESGSSI